MFFPSTFRDTPSIAFAFVATHNHFVLDRGGKVFNRSAPIIKLPADATEDDHLALLGLLNSSTACFWMKQVFSTKAAAVSTVAFKMSLGTFYEHRRDQAPSFPILDYRARPCLSPASLTPLPAAIVDLSPAELVKREVPTGQALRGQPPGDGAAPGPDGRPAGGTRLALLPALRADGAVR